MLQDAQHSYTLYMHLYMGKHPGANFKEIKALGAEETMAQLEESQREDLLTCKQNDPKKQAQQHMKNQSWKTNLNQLL